MDMETENTNKQFSIDNLLEKPKELLCRLKKAPSKLKAGILAALAMAIALVVYAPALFPSGPSDAVVKREYDEHVLASLPDVGIYDAGGSWKIDSVDVTSKEKRDVEPFLTAQFGETYYEVHGKVKASNGSAELERVLSCNFVMHEGEWQPLTDPDTESETWRATAAPDEKKLGENGIEAIGLKRA